MPYATQTDPPPPPPPPPPQKHVYLSYLNTSHVTQHKTHTHATKEELERKYLALIHAYGQDLRAVQEVNMHAQGANGMVSFVCLLSLCPPVSLLTAPYVHPSTHHNPEYNPTNKTNKPTIQTNNNTALPPLPRVPAPRLQSPPHRRRPLLVPRPDGPCVMWLIYIYMYTYICMCARMRTFSDICVPHVHPPRPPPSQSNVNQTTHQQGIATPYIHPHTRIGTHIYIHTYNHPSTGIRTPICLYIFI
jgi:hypothetical protein